METDRPGPSDSKAIPAADPSKTGIAEEARDINADILQVMAGAVLGLAPFIIGEIWVDSKPIGRGRGHEVAFFGSVVANVIAFLLATTLHGIAIPLLLHFKKPLIAAGIGLFYGIAAIVLLWKLVNS